MVSAVILLEGTNCSQVLPTAVWLQVLVEFPVCSLPDTADGYDYAAVTDAQQPSLLTPRRSALRQQSDGQDTGPLLPPGLACSSPTAAESAELTCVLVDGDQAQVSAAQLAAVAAVHGVRALVHAGHNDREQQPAGQPHVPRDYGLRSAAGL